MKLILSLFTLFFFSSLMSQERIDNTVEFQTDPAKQYSIYLPSSYNANEPISLMLGLHPWNVNRWNSISWCDTLINFAEMNGLLLVCPDGGADGKVDDPIDLDFTTYLLDDVIENYNVDTTKIYAMGFSWGGKTTYTYGLQNSGRFAGLMPIGAAINGAGELSGLETNSNELPVYVIHGDNDSPSVRYEPLLAFLNDNNACVNSVLLENVGHTIDFENRDEILSIGYNWLVNENCGTTSAIEESSNEWFTGVNIYPNPVTEPVTVEFIKPFTGLFQIISMEGKELLHAELVKAKDLSLPPGQFKGLLIIRLINPDQGMLLHQQKILFQ